jgi:hypothetical protein
MTPAPTPAPNARIWAAMTALTHHTGRAANARKFEAVAPAKRTGAPVTLGRVNARKSDAGKRFGSDAK